MPNVLLELHSENVEVLVVALIDDELMLPIAEVVGLVDCGEETACEVSGAVEWEFYVASVVGGEVEFDDRLAGADRTDL